MSGSSRNRKNAYFCDTCHGYIVTIDLEEGVTPMFLTCRVKGEPRTPENDCLGRMHSMMYPDEPWPDRDGYGNEIPTEPTWEWYKPDEQELKRMRRKGDEAGIEHVRKGGLMLRQKT